MTASQVRPPFDTEIERALGEFADTVVCTMSADDLESVRSLSTVVPVSDLTLHGFFERKEVLAQTPHGEVPLAVYLPRGAKTPRPYIVHLHGGGMITGTVDSDVLFVNEMAAQFGFAVVSVDYRLAPEHPYPAALEDVTGAVSWLRQTDDLQLDHSRSILSGVSAGGGLAAATALYQRDHGGVPFVGLLLMCPMLDQRNNSGSAVQMRGVGSWDQTANATAWSLYLAGQEPDQYASAALAQNLGGLPPVFVDVGSAETFRDECTTFAQQIWSDGGEAELHVWAGGCHAFDFLAPWAALSKSARQARLGWVQRTLLSK